MSCENKLKTVQNCLGQQYGLGGAGGDLALAVAVEDDQDHILKSNIKTPAEQKLCQINTLVAQHTGHPIGQAFTTDDDPPTEIPGWLLEENRRALLRRLPGRSAETIAGALCRIFDAYRDEYCRVAKNGDDLPFPESKFRGAYRALLECGGQPPFPEEGDSKSHLYAMQQASMQLMCEVGMDIKPGDTFYLQVNEIPGLPFREGSFFKITIAKCGYGRASGFRLSDFMGAEARGTTEEMGSEVHVLFNIDGQATVFVPGQTEAVDLRRRLDAYLTTWHKDSIPVLPGTQRQDKLTFTGDDGIQVTAELMTYQESVEDEERREKEFNDQYWSHSPADWDEETNGPWYTPGDFNPYRELEEGCNRSVRSFLSDIEWKEDGIYMRGQDLYMALRDTEDKVIGAISACYTEGHRTRPELRYYIVPKHRGKGLMRQAVSAMMEQVSARYGCGRFFVQVNKHDEQTQDVAKALGFTQTAEDDSELARKDYFREVALGCDRTNEMVLNTNPQLRKVPSFMLKRKNDD